MLLATIGHHPVPGKPAGPSNGSRENPPELPAGEEHAELLGAETENPNAVAVSCPPPPRKAKPVAGCWRRLLLHLDSFSLNPA